MAALLHSFGRRRVLSTEPSCAILTLAAAAVKEKLKKVVVAGRLSLDGVLPERRRSSRGAKDSGSTGSGA